MLMKSIAELRKIAYREAAALLRVTMDQADLPQELTEDDESFVREYIRNEICDGLAKKGGGQ